MVNKIGKQIGKQVIGKFLHSVLHCKNRNQFIQFQKNLNFLYDYTNIFPFLPMHDFSLLLSPFSLLYNNKWTRARGSCLGYSFAMLFRYITIPRFIAYCRFAICNKQIGKLQVSNSQFAISNFPVIAVFSTRVLLTSLKNQQFFLSLRSECPISFHRHRQQVACRFAPNHQCTKVLSQ